MAKFSKKACGRHTPVSMIAAGGVLLAMIVGLMACGSTSQGTVAATSTATATSEQTATATAEPTATATAEPTAPTEGWQQVRLYQPKTYDGWIITVGPSQSSIDPAMLAIPFLPAVDGGKYVMITVNFKNVSDQERTIDGGQQFALLDKSGKVMQAVPLGDTPIADASLDGVTVAPAPGPGFGGRLIYIIPAAQFKGGLYWNIYGKQFE